MIVNEFPQGSEGWISARCGIFSASNFDKLITTKGDPSKQADKYIYQIAAEKVSGLKEESFQNAAMLKGIETEAEAVAFYEMTHGHDTKEVGFITDDLKRWGCSPDRLVGEDGLLEVKCPLPHTHISYLVDGGLYQDYLQQTQGQLFVTGRKWCDLISYSRGLKSLVVRVEIDEAFHKRLEDVLVRANQTLNEIVKKISNA